ncbi:NUDIX domain-containing protein [Paenibacillus terrigena]|uniref:NUDIX hydrolase n=1 Tax=Paenibacillus terrigena TaxID=369333 RepID=UPI0028D35318|nr:NUDIX domain-containing protein [Paenibacillus terrigena]
MVAITNAKDEELFDIYDEAMNHLGVAARSEVHAKGYWHQSFHCWIVSGEGANRQVLFQQRNALKDTFPNCYDITAAGHLAAGETVRQAARELEEELGLTVAFEALTPLGAAQYENTGEVRGVPFIDREYCHLFGVRCDQPLTSYRLQASEVAGLYQASLREMLELLAGACESVDARGIAFPPGERPGQLASAGAESADGVTALSVCSVRLTRHDFVPHGDAYYERVLTALAAL